MTTSEATRSGAAAPDEADVADEVHRRLAAAGVVPDADSPRAHVHGHEGAYVVRDFLTRARVPFRYHPGDGPCSVDVVDGPRLDAPTLRELADAVGLPVRPAHDEYDLVVVGGGPAGLSAAVYGAAEGLRTLVVERFAPGGQAGTSSLIENYVGFPDGISGNDLAERAYRQATRLGADWLFVSEVVRGGDAPQGWQSVVTDDDVAVHGRAVVCATGVEWRELPVPGLDELYGRGVYYGAATSEAPGLEGRDVFVVGGGNSAGQAAMFFSRWAASVTVLVRGDALADSLSRYLLERVEATDERGRGPRARRWWAWPGTSGCGRSRCATPCSSSNFLCSSWARRGAAGRPRARAVRLHRRGAPHAVGPGPGHRL